MSELLVPFRFLLLSLVVLAVADAPAAAQESDALRFFQSNPSRGLLRPGPVGRAIERPLLQRDSASERGVVRRSSPRIISPRVNPSVLARPELAPDKPVVAPTTFIHVVGDSLSELLAQGLKDGLVERPDVGIVRHSRSSSGIVRDDYFNWAKTLRDMLAGSEVPGAGKIDLLVMMIGSNDRQPLRDETGSHEFRTEQWRDLYIKRLDEIMGIAREKRVPLIWVGLPVMQSQKFSADMLYLNSIFKERANRVGLPYVDVWEGFANEQGLYASLGPDVNGTSVKMRTIDGVHFTKAGARKLAFFVSKETDAQLSRQRGSTDIATLPPDVSEQLKREQTVVNAPASATLAPATLAPAVLPPAVLPNLQESLILPEEMLKAPSIGERPLTGQIVVLTQPPVSAGSKLLQGPEVPAVNEMSILTEQVMGYGKVPVAKTGRVDDFRWTPASRPTP